MWLPRPGCLTSSAASWNAVRPATRSAATRAPISTAHWRCARALANQAPGRRCVADQVVHDHHRASGFEAEVHARQARGAKTLGDLLLVFGLAVEEEEAASARAGDLAAGRAGRSGQVVPAVDRGPGYPAGQPAFGQPGLVQVLPNPGDVSPAQVVAHRLGGRLDAVEALDRGCQAVLPLLLQDLAGVVPHAGEEEHQALREGRQNLGARIERLDFDTPAPEAEEVEPAEGGRVLVLLADRHLQLVDLDEAGQLGDLAGGQPLPAH